MSYQVIARKWRPQTFEEVTGQEPITRTLRNAVEHERLHHAYLFSGARGVGKTTTARLLAKALNCHKSDRPTPTPCALTDDGACASCREVAEGRSIDVLEIDAASNTGVDNVREAIINTVGVRPARDRFKVFIIDEVHMLSGAAFNALLKTLEEPPPRVVFIMATTELHRLPETILSRCQQFEFRTIAAPKIVERLRLIADEEKIKVSDEALREIARAGEGSMRDAQSAFDQVISFSAGEIDVGDVETALGVAGAEMLARVVRAVAEGAPAEALAVVDNLVMRGHDLRHFCRDLMSHVRDLLVVKVAGEAAELTEAGQAERRTLAREAAGFSESDLVRFFHSLTETEKLLRESAHPRYQLEVGLVKLIEMRRLAPLAQILERLGALEENLRAGTSPAGGATPPAAPTAPATGGGTAPRRGVEGGGSRGAAQAFDSPPEQAAPPTPRGDEPDNQDAKSHAPAVAETPPFEPPPPRATPSTAKAIPTLPPRGAAPSSPAAPNLKLVTSAPSANVVAAAPPPSFFDPPMEDGGNGSAPTFRQAKVSPEAEASPFDAGERPGAGHDGVAGRVMKLLDERRKPFLVIALEGARKLSLDGDELSVEFAPEARHLRDALSKPDAMKALREACCEAAGRQVGVRIAVAEPGADGGDPAARTREDAEREEQRRLREMAEQHPAVRELLRTFRAEIIEVRRVDAEGK